MDLGFWMGLWHGLRAPIVFIINLFQDPNINLYAIENKGGMWYDFGFLVALLCIWGGAFSVHTHKKKTSKNKKEWEEIGDKIEKKVMVKLKAWVEEPEGKDKDKEWDEIGKKVEEKIKAKLKKWAEERD